MAHKIIFVVNEAQFLLSHRRALLEQALADGMQVLVASAADTGEEQFAELNVEA